MNGSWAEERFIRVEDDVSLRVLVAGEGEPVLLLHGFPDSAELWRFVAPRLAAGYRIIAPDQRGFGRSDAPRAKARYDARRIAADAIAVLDALGVERARLVGHDWGAAIGWFLAGVRPDRFVSYTALSVGHPAAYARAGLEQKLKGWYVAAFQLPGIAEALLSASDFALFKRFMGRQRDTDRWVADLARPGRLTAALDWYRANFVGFLKTPSFRVKIPVMGVWSSRDIALAEDQMTRSAEFVDAPFRYERIDNVGHWIPADAPDRLAELLLDFWREPQG